MRYEQVYALDCENSIRLLTISLLEHGYRVERSFDLRSAMNDRVRTPCPYHGRFNCACQFVVLLAYAQPCAAPPVVITAHECEGCTRIKLEALPASGEVWSKLNAALNQVAAAAEAV